MRILRARLLAAAQEEADARGRRTRAAARCAPSTAPSGSAPTTSRRTGSPTTGSNFKAYNLDQVLDGDLDAVVQALRRRRHRGQARRREPMTPTACAAARGRGDRAAGGGRRAVAAATTPRSSPRTRWASTRRDLWRHDAAGDRTFEAYVDRRAAREPLQHITGRACFRHLDPRGRRRACSCRGRRPRSWSARSLAAAARWRRPRRVVVDLGTGSGAIALAVADEVAGREVHAVELDPAAHAWAARNCAGSTGRPAGSGDMADAFAELDGTSTSWSATRRTSRWAR